MNEANTTHQCYASAVNVGYCAGCGKSMKSDTPIADRLDALADRLGGVHMLMARELRSIVRDVVRLERRLP